MSSPEDGLKAYNLAMKNSADGNLSGALKWARKALSIDPSLARAQVLLTALEKGHMPGHAEASSSSSSSSTARGAGVNGDGAAGEGIRRRGGGASSEKTAGPNGKAREMNGSVPEKKRDYTQEQMRVVTMVNKAGREHDYYGVLMLKKADSPDDNAIKKGYRKLALQLHPDKNGAPGADEAFKIVSKAFTILSDPDKRAAHDRFGGDPDARGGRAGPSAASAFANGGAPGFRTYGGGGMGAEIDPNDLFNMFFGGGMGNGFGGGTTFSFGGPGGVHMHQFGGNGRRYYRQGGAGAQRQNDSSPMLLQLLPILLLGLFSLLSFLPSLFSTPDPLYAWSPQGSFRQARNTPTHNVKYFVDPSAWNQHPWVSAAAKTSNSNQDDRAEAARASANLQGFEHRVENAYKNVLYNDCERRREYQARRLQSAQGVLFGIGADREAQARIRAETYDSCERLRDFGVNFGLNI